MGGPLAPCTERVRVPRAGGGESPAGRSGWSRTTALRFIGPALQPTELLTVGVKAVNPPPSRRRVATAPAPAERVGANQARLLQRVPSCPIPGRPRVSRCRAPPPWSGAGESNPAHPLIRRVACNRLPLAPSRRRRTRTSDQQAVILLRYRCAMRRGAEKGGVTRSGVSQARRGWRGFRDPGPGFFRPVLCRLSYPTVKGAVYPRARCLRT